MRKQRQRVFRFMWAMILITAMLLTNVQPLIAAGLETESERQTEAVSQAETTAPASEIKESETAASETAAAVETETEERSTRAEESESRDTKEETEEETGKTQKPAGRDGEVFTPAAYSGTGAEALPAEIETVKEAGGKTDKVGYYVYKLQGTEADYILAYGTYGAAGATGLELSWYHVGANGEVDTDKAYQTDEMLAEYINIAVKGFVQQTPTGAEVADFYSGPEHVTGEHTWAASRNVYSFIDKNDSSTKYRVYGSYNSIPGYYHCDQYGNVAYPAPQPADLDQDEENVQKDPGVFTGQTYPGSDLDSNIIEDPAKNGYYSYEV